MGWLFEGVLLGIGLLIGVWLLLALMDWFADNESGQTAFSIVVGVAACCVAVLLGLGLFIGARALIGN